MEVASWTLTFMFRSLHPESAPMIVSKWRLVSIQMKWVDKKISRWKILVAPVRTG